MRDACRSPKRARVVIRRTDRSCLRRNLFRLTSTRGTHATASTSSTFTPHNEMSPRSSVSSLSLVNNRNEMRQPSVMASARAVAVIPSRHASELRAPAPRVAMRSSHRQNAAEGGLEALGANGSDIVPHRPSGWSLHRAKRTQCQHHSRDIPRYLQMTPHKNQGLYQKLDKN